MMPLFFANAWAWLTSKVAMFVAGALVVLALVLTIFRKGEKSGAATVVQKQKEKTDAVLQKMDEIDARSPNFDDAINRLRQRSGDDSDVSDTGEPAAGGGGRTGSRGP